MRLKIHPLSITFALAVILAVIAFVPSAKANVYATNIKLNGALTNVTASQGTSLSISYILNEPATMGVTVQILSGTNVVRSISLTSGSSGTLKGSNVVTWDGKNGSGTLVGAGTYNVSITAAASGFVNWTQTSTDTNAGYYVYAPRGMAVNTNPKSPYYGRVFVGNARDNSNGSAPGDVDGILKLNADGSLADEGQSTGGYYWRDDDYFDSPHFLRYGQDDRIYALDYTGQGIIVACDMAMTTNQVVLSANNYSYSSQSYANAVSMGSGWSMIDVTDAGTTNGRLWLGNPDYPDGAGLWTWHMTNGVANPNDMGTQVIAPGGSLTAQANGGSMMDESSNVFVGQDQLNAGDSNPRAILFTNWNGTTAFVNGATWSVGSNDNNFLGSYDLALDSRSHPKYIAFSLSGPNGSPAGLRVLNTTNGLVVTDGTQVLTNIDVANDYFGVSWDAVGNLYGASSSLNAWRVFSPPGTNQATTVAVENVQILTGPTQPQFMFSSIVISNTTIIMAFTGLSGDTASTFTLQSSKSGLVGIYTNVGSAVITQISSGNFQATTAKSGATQFFRLKR